MLTLILMVFNINITHVDIVYFACRGRKYTTMGYSMYDAARCVFFSRWQCNLFLSYFGEVWGGFLLHTSTFLRDLWLVYICFSFYFPYNLVVFRWIHQLFVFWGVFLVINYFFTFINYFVISLHTCIYKLCSIMNF